jgi:hypothetical protein
MSLEVAPEPMVMKLSSLLIGILISVYHCFIFSPCIVYRPVRVTTIHSP